MKTYTEDQVKEMITKAFIAGENWGVTYQGWFIPTEEQKATRCAENCDKIIKEASTSDNKALDIDLVSDLLPCGETSCKYELSEGERACQFCKDELPCNNR